MNKIQVTPQQRANALEALDVMWPSVPPENVQRRLSIWRDDQANTEPTCNTIACFGGWCAWWPNFRAQGVTTWKDGRPHIDGVEDTDEVARILFGYEDMFAPAGGARSDGGYYPKVADHELVTKRLKWLIANSEVVA
jgi:hypothetical protein